MLPFSVHYSLNPFSKYYYQTQPRQLSAMKANSWTNLSGEDCTNGGKYNGFRYIENTETPGLALLYDVQGTIAGIQMIVSTRIPLQVSFVSRIPLSVLLVGQSHN